MVRGGVVDLGALFAESPTKCEAAPARTLVPPGGAAGAAQGARAAAGAEP
jgi:hypothetical protein